MRREIKIFITVMIVFGTIVAFILRSVGESMLGAILITAILAIMWIGTGGIGND